MLKRSKYNEIYKYRLLLQNILKRHYKFYKENLIESKKFKLIGFDLKKGELPLWTDVYSANEAFVTGTFGGLTPVTQVDGRKIADGRIGKTTMLLQDLYKEVVNAEVSK